jgi:hypothetical protein
MKTGIRDSGLGVRVMKTPLSPPLPRGELKGGRETRNTKHETLLVYFEGFVWAIALLWLACIVFPDALDFVLVNYLKVIP